MVVYAPKKIRNKIVSPLKVFIADSRSTGIILIACTILSLTISNLSFGQDYVAFWQQKLCFTQILHLPENYLHIINDGLMSIFFLLVGLEIKRELLIGEISQLKKALLPIIAAIGGMVIPALIYLAFCSSSSFSNGWGIPIATDIVFSLAILSLLGNRVPLSLKIFLMALAIIDDLGGIVTIALFYAVAINWSYVLLSFVISFLMYFLGKKKYLWLHFLTGIVLWYFLYNSGIHPTIAGVIFAMTFPLSSIEMLERKLHFPVNFLILPLFVLANTTLIFPGNFTTIFHSKVALGIFFGLVVGKPLGIVLFSWLSVRLKMATLPHGVRWQQLIGVGIVAGIGFTISIFIATLAFQGNEQQTIAKMAVLMSSVVAAILGYVFLSKQKST